MYTNLTSSLPSEGFPEEIEKADDKRKGQASIALGIGSGTVAIRHNAVANAVNAAHQRRYDRKIDETNRAYGARGKKLVMEDPRKVAPGSVTQDSIGRNVYHSPTAKKAYKSTAKELRRGKFTRLNELRTARNRVPLGGPGRSKLLAASTAVAVPALWHGTRQQVKKDRDVRRRDVDAGFLGAAAGAGGYQEVTYKFKGLDKKNEQKIAADPALKQRMRNYEKQMGKPKGAIPAGHPYWKQHFKHYPKDLPGGKLKHFNRVAFTGKTGVGLTAAAGAAGAAGAMKLSQKHRVQKSYIPGKGWVSAADASKRALRGAAKGNRYTQMRGVPKNMERRRQTILEANGAFRGLIKDTEDAANGNPSFMAQAHDMITGERPAYKVERHAKGGTAHSNASDMARVAGPQAEAFAVNMGGRSKADRWVFQKPGADQNIVNHEAAHTSPDRSSWRMHQITSDPKKAMREEARADYSAGTYYRKTPEQLKAEGRFESGYHAAAHGNEKFRRNIKRGTAQQIVARKLSGREGGGNMWKNSAVHEYRKVQDKIASSQNIPAARGRHFYGNQWMTREGAKRHAKQVGLGTAGAGAFYGIHHHKEVSKMSPDQADVHVMGSGGRRGKLRPMTRQKSKTANNG